MIKNKSIPIMHAALKKASLRPQSIRYLPGPPDFIWLRKKTVLFVDVCLRHCCPKHCSVPNTNTRFWMQKFARNRNKDKKNNKKLREAGWTVYRIWECTAKAQPTILARSMKLAISKPVSAGSFLLNYARSSPTSFIKMFSHR